MLIFICIIAAILAVRCFMLERKVELVSKEREDFQYVMRGWMNIACQQINTTNKKITNKDGLILNLDDRVSFSIGDCAYEGKVVLTEPDNDFVVDFDRPLEIEYTPPGNKKKHRINADFVSNLKITEHYNAFILTKENNK